MGRRMDSNSMLACESSGEDNALALLAFIWPSRERENTRPRNGSPQAETTGDPGGLPDPDGAAPAPPDQARLRHLGPPQALLVKSGGHLKEYNAVGIMIQKQSESHHLPG